jgi:hypothetical protein
MRQSVLPFWDFCEQVLKLHLTPGQRVIAKVAFGNLEPADLVGEERELALQMFGGVERVPELAKTMIVLRLGRASGKTTLCSAFAVYTCVTFDVSKIGPGSTPYVIIVAPDKPTAQLSVRMCREMIRSHPALERMVVADRANEIQLRRPDGVMVRIEAFAATKGGASMRGRDTMAFIMDEAEFFTSNDGSEGKDYAVNDADIFRAVSPRVMPGGKTMLISTPWPVETFMGKNFDDNYGKCTTAVAIRAPTLLVRGTDSHIKKMVEAELQRDPENARREYFCELDGISGGDFFDVNALASSIETTHTWPIAYDPKLPCAVGCDLGFTSDSSAIAVVQYDGRYYRLVYSEELRPKPGKPLQPSAVIKRFTEIARRYGGTSVIADIHYRESLKEQLREHGMSVIPAPNGSSGKADVFQRTRAVLHEGLVRIPESALGRRLIQQAKTVVSKAAPGGTVTIRVPRKVGMGHGDLVSAWTLAVHHLAYAHVKAEKLILEPGTPEWQAESQRRMVSYQEKQQRDYLKKLEKEQRSRMNERAYRQMFGPRP